MFIQRPFEVITARALPPVPIPRADDALHHTHVALTPGTQLLIDLQQTIQQLKGSCKNGIAAAEHNK